MQLGVVDNPLISRQKVVERQRVGSTRDEEIPRFCFRFAFAKLAHRKKLLRQTLRPDRQARLELASRASMMLVLQNLLAAGLATAYDRSRYSRRINDEAGVTGPVKDGDRQWIETVRKRR